VEFTVTVSGSSIASFSANIPVDGGGTVPKPTGTLKPVVNTNISGTYIDEDDDNSFTLTFSGGTSGTVTMTASAFGMQIQAGGNYTVAGNKITITVTSSNNPFTQAGEKYTYTIIDDNTILDDEDGAILKKR
jgi:flagellar basal body L-ring protein FlgH